MGVLSEKYFGDSLYSDLSVSEPVITDAISEFGSKYGNETFGLFSVEASLVK